MYLYIPILENKTNIIILKNLFIETKTFRFLHTRSEMPPNILITELHIKMTVILIKDF